MKNVEDPIDRCDCAKLNRSATYADAVTTLNDHIALFAAINACDASLSRVLGGQEGRCAGCGEELPVGTPIIYLVHGEAAAEGRGDYHVNCFERWVLELVS